MIGLLLLILGLIGQWLLGAALAIFLLAPSDGTASTHPADASDAEDQSPSCAELLGLGLVFGIGVTAVVQFFWSLAGGSLGRPLSISLALLGVVAALLARRGRTRNANPKRQRGAAKSTSDDHAGRVLIQFCKGAITVLFISALIQTLLTPQRFWDERAIYGIKARVLFEDRTINSPDLLNPDFVQYHPRYPLLLPLAEQHVSALLGNADDRWSKILFPLLYLGLVLTFAGVVSRHALPERAWLFATMLATAPVLMPYEYGFLSAQADAPVACFHGVSLLYLWDWLRGDGIQGITYRPLFVAGLSAALTIFTKDEGLALFLVDLGVLTVIVIVQASFWRSRNWTEVGALIIKSSHHAPRVETVTRSVTATVAGRSPFLVRAIGSTALFFIVVAVVSFPWLWHRSRLPATTEMTYFNRLSPAVLAAGIESLRWSVPHLLRRMFTEAREWGLQWWLMLIAGITSPRRAVRPAQLLLIYDVLGALAALLVAGMVAPTPVEEHLGGSSHRFLMQLVPAALLFTAGQWGGDRRQPAR